MSGLDAPFLAAAADGVLVVQTCTACACAQLPPRLRCVVCGGADLEWRPASGAARLESFAVLHRAPDEAHRARLPYVYAVVALEEGPRMVTNVVDCDPAALLVDQPLRVAFRSLDETGQPWPVFVPA